MTHRTDAQKCCEKCMNWDDLACFDASCPCHNPHTPPSDWEKEFDRNFMSQGELLHVGDGEDDASDIKSFIHTHIEKAVREERGRIAFMVKTVLSGGNYYLRETLEKLYQTLTNKES